MATPEDIIVFAQGYRPRGMWGGKKGACLADGDLFDAFAIAGDDGNEFLQDFAVRFDVNLDGFLWYFHYNANEPPGAETSWPYTPDGRRLSRIPLTPRLLAEAANRRVWPVEYPEHVVKGAWKAKIPLIAMGLFVVIAVFLLLMA